MVTSVGLLNNCPVYLDCSEFWRTDKLSPKSEWLITERLLERLNIDSYKFEKLHEEKLFEMHKDRIYEVFWLDDMVFQKLLVWNYEWQLNVNSGCNYIYRNGNPYRNYDLWKIPNKWSDKHIPKPVQFVIDKMNFVGTISYTDLMAQSEFGTYQIKDPRTKQLIEQQDRYARTT